MADLETLRASVASLSDSPTLIERSAHALFVRDGDGVDDWERQSDAFKDIYHSEVQIVLAVVHEQLGEIDRLLPAA